MRQHWPADLPFFRLQRRPRHYFTALPTLLIPRKYDGDRTFGVDHLSCRDELSGARLEAKCDNGVALLVRGIEKASCGIKTNKARVAALSGLPAHRRQRSVGRIGGVDCHAVVTAVGTVYEAPVGRPRDFRGGAVARERRWKRGNNLDGRQRGALGVPTIRCGRTVKLVEHPDNRKLPVKYQMTRACARPRLDRIWLCWRQPTARGVETKDEDTVEPLVGHEDEASGGVERDVVRMRAYLLAFVRARLARQRHELVLVFKRPIGGDCQYRDA